MSVPGAAHRQLVTDLHLNQRSAGRRRELVRWRVYVGGARSLHPLAGDLEHVERFRAVCSQPTEVVPRDICSEVTCNNRIFPSLLRGSSDIHRFQHCTWLRPTCVGKSVNIRAILNYTGKNSNIVWLSLI